MLRVCKNCNRPYDLVNSGRGVFCSRDCYNQYRKTSPVEYRRVQYIELICEHCGRPFQRRKQEVRSTKNYCSKRCSGLSTTPPHKRAERKPAIDKVCEYCGKTYKVKPSRLNPRFCSKPCDWAYRSAHMIGNGNPNHRHGKSQMSAIAIAKRNYPMRCAVCGFDVIVDVHHILPKSEGGVNDPNNLIVLCPNHHRMAQRGMITVEELLSAREHTNSAVSPP